MEAQGECDTQHAEAGGVNVDQHKLIAMAGTTAMVGATMMSAHEPITMEGTMVMNAHAEDDDVPLSQVFCQATSNELVAKHVNCGPNLVVFVLFIAPCITICCILIFLQAQTNFLMNV